MLVILMWSGKWGYEQEVRGWGAGAGEGLGGWASCMVLVCCMELGGTSNIELAKALTADGDVVRGGGGRRGGHPLGDRLGRRVEHEICE